LLLYGTPGISFFVFHFYFLSFPEKPPMRQEFIRTASYYLVNYLQSCNFTLTAVMMASCVSTHKIFITETPFPLFFTFRFRPKFSFLSSPQISNYNFFIRTCPSWHSGCSYKRQWNRRNRKEKFPKSKTKSVLIILLQNAEPASDREDSAERKPRQEPRRK
jgi:hypothetical protein